MDNSYDSDLEELKRWFGSDDDDEDDHDGEDELDGVWVSDEEDRDVENNQFVAIEGLEDYDTLEDIAVTVEAIADDAEMSIHNSTFNPSLVEDVRRDVLQMYDVCCVESKATAEEVNGWLLGQFQKSPDFDNYWMVEEAKGIRFITAKQTVKSRIRYLIVEPYEVNGAWKGGFELVLAIGLHVNRKLIPHIKHAAKNSTNLSSSILPEVTRGNARVSPSWGVYILQVAENQRIIVGSTLMPFIKRVGNASYSKTQGIVAALGPYRDDQRKGRTPQDYVLFDPILFVHWSHPQRWLVQALQTLGIIMFEANNEKFGLNTDSAFGGNYRSPLTPEQLRALWKAVRAVTRKESMPSPSGIIGKATFSKWYTTHLLPRVRWGEHPPLSAPAAQVIIAEIVRVSEYPKQYQFCPLHKTDFKNWKPYPRTRSPTLALYPNFRIAKNLPPLDPELAAIARRLDLDASWRGFVENHCNGIVPSFATDWNPSTTSNVTSETPNIGTSGKRGDHSGATSTTPKGGVRTSTTKGNRKTGEKVKHDGEDEDEGNRGKGKEPAKQKK